MSEPTPDSGGPPGPGESDGLSLAPTALGAHAAEAVGTEREPFIVLKGLVKRYPGVVALDHADGVIVPGAIVGLLGKNGAGKSTLIKILAGVVQPDEGQMFIDGEPVHLSGPLDATRRGLAFVHQELTDVPNLTVAENIELGLGYPKVAGTFVKRRALRRKSAAVLERLGARIDPKSKLASLSIAERRLVVIARGLATNARLLVLDEPTASLTDEEITHLHDVLRLLRDEGVAIVYVTHRLQEVYDVTDDVAVMRDGKMVFESPTAKVERSQLIEHITGPQGGHAGQSAGGRPKARSPARSCCGSKGSAATASSRTRASSCARATSSASRGSSARDARSSCGSSSEPTGPPPAGSSSRAGR